VACPRGRQDGAPMSASNEPPRGARHLRVPTELAGERLDRALAALCADVSRTRLKAAIQAGGVRVDGATVDRPGQPVEADAQIEVDGGALAPRVRAGSDELDFQVLFEDEHLAVIVKPAGMLSHPTDAVRGGTVSELAERRFGPLPSLQGSDRPGIVHRLDGGTSGVMVLGRSERAFAELMRQFRAREVEKTYLALVWGEPRFDTGWIEAPIARSAAVPSRMDIAAEGEGRDAATWYEVRERFGVSALVEASPKSGRTHQIRVHLASIGHPLIGDSVYKRKGGPPVRLAADAPLPARQALHAHALRFKHPVGGQAMAFEAPLPEDMTALLEWLRREHAQA
jgi:23S rRNA pseudouridine1911/1915/1917 synthase